MALVEASATTRAVCRECGSAIEAGEPRFGQDEDSSDGPRIRWRHLACAAQALPEALLRALELGGWQAVPDDEHDELRTLIDRAIAARRAPAKAMPEARAARSSSAMAAAAVLEPAHEAAALPLALARAWVFADALQARGDARGELLALELAAEHTDDPLQARALQREHHACWRAVPATLPASAALRLRRLGGFVLGGYPKQRRELQRLLASPDAALLARVRLDFCTPEELSELVELANAHARALRAIDLISSRASDLQPLTELDQLEWLCVSDRFDPAVLAQLPRLRGLSVSSAEQLDSAELEPLAASLEVLELLDIDISRIDALGQQLPALARLNLVLVRFDGEPELLRGATSLRSLRLLGTPLRSLAPLASLPALRELSITPGKLHVVSELATLTELERLALTGSKVGELEPLTALSALQHLTLSATRTTQLEPLASLPRLRSLTIQRGDLRKISGLDKLTQLEQLRLVKVANFDLASLARLDRLHTLVLDLGGARPRSLESLAHMPALRRISMPVELFNELWAPHRLLARIEDLELSGERLPELARVAKLARLRRLLVPNRDPAKAEQLADALPEVAIATELTPHDRLDRPDPFDWRNVEWPNG